MRMRLPRWVAAHSPDRGGFVLAVVFAAAVLLEFAAGIGLSYVAGFSAVRQALTHIDWTWLAALLAALAASFAGYWYAYRGILRVGGGPELPGPQMHALVAAGFGGLLSHGGGVLERRARATPGRESLRWPAWSRGSWPWSAAPPRSRCWATDSAGRR
jgi:hypothetical protein